MKRSLTATAVAGAKPKTDDYKLSDGGGMFLFVTKAGTKSWRYKYRLLKKERVFVIGTFPGVSLQEARKAHEAARGLVSQGLDPGHDRKARVQKNLLASSNTFESLARDYVLKKSAKGDSAKRWTPAYSAKVMRMLERELFPKIGTLKIEDVRGAELAPILEAIAERKEVRMPHQKKVRQRTRGATTTARHLLQTCRSIFFHAAAKGVENLKHDPTWALKGLISTPSVKHNSHLSLEQMPKFWEDLETVAATESVKIAIELLALTFVRTGELRNAEWSEFDITSSSKYGPHWRIPAIRMKKRREHMVPLSASAIYLLEKLRAITGNSQYLFPSRAEGARAMNANTINQVLYRMGYAGRLSGHGFRATASTALNESGFAPHLIESQLAHGSFQNKTAAAYNHAQYWEDRRKMMDQWQQMIFCASPNVVPIKKHG